MPVTASTSSQSLNGDHIQASTQAALDGLYEAVKRTSVVANLVDVAPQHVSEKALSETREQLERALKSLEPHLRLHCIDKDAIANYYRDLCSLYGESIQRQFSEYGPQLGACFNPLAPYSMSKKTVERLKHYQGQVFALERAVQLSVKPSFKLYFQRQLKNVLAQYFINTTLHYLNIEIVGKTKFASGHASMIPAESRTKNPHQTRELGIYLGSLSKGIRELCQKLPVARDALLQDPKHRRECGDLLVPLFSPWIGQLREHALGLANVLFKIQTSSLDVSTRSTDKADLNNLLDDMFESAVYMMDVNDRLIAHGYGNPLPNNAASRKGTSTAALDVVQTGLAALRFKQFDEPASDDTFADSENVIDSDVPAEGPSENTRQTRRKTQYIEKLLAQMPFEHFEKLNSSRHTFHPDTVLNSAYLAIEQASRLKNSLLKQLQAPAIENPQLLEAVNQKIACLDEALCKLKVPVLQIDLYKHYSLPQTEHWRLLLDQKEVSEVGDMLRLPSSTEHVYEIRITPKPDSEGYRPEPVYLHLHLKKPPRSKNKKDLFANLLNQPDLLEAAHLKSSYYRRKGKAWESNQQAKGLYETLVARSPINKTFLAAMRRFLINKG